MINSPKDTKSQSHFQKKIQEYLEKEQQELSAKYPFYHQGVPQLPDELYPMPKRRTNHQIDEIPNQKNTSIPNIYNNNSSNNVINSNKNLRRKSLSTNKKKKSNVFFEERDKYIDLSEFYEDRMTIIHPIQNNDYDQNSFQYPQLTKQQLKTQEKSLQIISEQKKNMNNQKKLERENKKKAYDIYLEQLNDPTFNQVVEMTKDPEKKTIQIIMSNENNISVDLIKKSDLKKIQEENQALEEQEMNIQNKKKSLKKRLIDKFKIKLNYQNETFKDKNIYDYYDQLQLMNLNEQKQNIFYSQSQNNHQNNGQQDNLIQDQFNRKNDGNNNNNLVLSKIINNKDKENNNNHLRIIQNNSNLLRNKDSSINNQVLKNNEDSNEIKNNQNIYPQNIIEVYQIQNQSNSKQYDKKQQQQLTRQFKSVQNSPRMNHDIQSSISKYDNSQDTIKQNTTSNNIQNSRNEKINSNQNQIIENILNDNHKLISKKQDFTSKIRYSTPKSVLIRIDPNIKTIDNNNNNDNNIPSTVKSSNQNNNNFNHSIRQKQQISSQKVYTEGSYFPSSSIKQNSYGQSSITSQRNNSITPYLFSNLQQQQQQQNINNINDEEQNTLQQQQQNSYSKYKIQSPHLRKGGIYPLRRDLDSSTGTTPTILKQDKNNIEVLQKENQQLLNSKYTSEHARIINNIRKRSQSIVSQMNELDHSYDNILNKIKYKQIKILNNFSQAKAPQQMQSRLLNDFHQILSICTGGNGNGGSASPLLN